MLDRPDTMHQDGALDSIRHISDEDLFAAMDLSRDGLERVHEAVEKLDDAGAYRAWGDYWETASRRVSFTGEGELLMDKTEAAKSLEPRRAEIIQAAERVLRHDI